ncbi:unnamed protein product [Leptidea sinapis]|uniref:Uncharacterized protein n=1 Tax=Leptidea sinapis TaxID=189913 RepID=A0A5E4QPS4_9NEOP|nr:unnamed protein product [Leptidea sinapis]
MRPLCGALACCLASGNMTLTRPVIQTTLLMLKRAENAVPNSISLEEGKPKRSIRNRKESRKVKRYCI